MIVDLHTHVWDRPEQFGSAAMRVTRRVTDAPWQQPDSSPQAFDEAMAPVAFAVVHGYESGLLEASIPIDLVARFVARNRKKYLGFAGIDPLLPAALRRVDDAIDAGLVGVTISPAAAGFHPAHTRAMALYEKCESLNLPVMIECDPRVAPAARMEFAQPHLFDEVARTFPKLTLVLSQVGYPWTEQALALISKHERVWADVSMVVEQPWLLYNVLLAAHQTQAMSRLLFGSRFPFATPQHAISTMYSVNTLTQGTNLPSVPREQLRSIIERDALACLGISPITTRATSTAAAASRDAAERSARSASPSPDNGNAPASAASDALAPGSAFKEAIE